MAIYKRKRHTSTFTEPSPHAMVLDTIINDNTFVFKNTYEDETKVKIQMDDKNAPKEFFFVHINYKKKN